MGTFYVRKKADRARRGSWTIVEAKDATSARRKFVVEENTDCRRRYAKYPVLLKHQLIKMEDVSVRKTPPPRGDIYRVDYSKKSPFTDDWIYPVYTPRKTDVFKGRSKIKTSLQDKQMALLTAMSQRIQWPLRYSDDLYVHDKRTLKKHHPNRFIWSVRKSGTELCSLDKKGQPLTPREYQWNYGMVKQDLVDIGTTRKYFLITRTTIKAISGKNALDIMLKAFKKAYPRMDIEGRI